MALSCTNLIDSFPSLAIFTASSEVIGERERRFPLGHFLRGAMRENDDRYAVDGVRAIPPAGGHMSACRGDSPLVALLAGRAARVPIEEVSCRLVSRAGSRNTFLSGDVTIKVI